MASRLQKQFFYGIFYIVFFAAIIVGSYYLFIKPAPSCFDNIQNQGEQGIDCGGPCAKICIPQTIKQIAVSRPFAFVLDKSHIGLLAQINNPNSDYAAKNFSYKFSVYNNAGALIQSFSGESFAYAGEVKYVLVPNVSIPDTNFARTDFLVENTDWTPASQFGGLPMLSLSGVKNASAAGGVISANGQITNKDTISFSKVAVIAVFHGKFGQIDGASQTELENLSPNESRPFSITHPPLADVNLSATEIAAYALRR
jgi:hypothetical protein